MAAYFELSKLILNALDVYDRYRSQEATAKLLSLDISGFTIEFKGAFRQNCDVRAYFEDFIYELKRFNKCVNAEVHKYEPVGAQSFKVRYTINNRHSEDDSTKNLFAEFLNERG